MPDAQGNIRGIAISGKAAESWERIFGRREPPSVPGCGYPRPGACYCCDPPDGCWEKVQAPDGA